MGVFALRSCCAAAVLSLVVAGCGRAPSQAPNAAADNRPHDAKHVSAASVPAASPGTEVVGSSSCRQCHEDFYTLWAPSHHGLAMQPYTAEFAAANLSPQTDAIKIGERSYRAEVGADGGWVVEHGPEGERKLPIAHVLGGKNVYYFLTPWRGGRLQTLPLAYDVHQEAWYDTAKSGVRHVPGGPEDAPLDWTDPEFTFNASCYSCHVSQLATNYDLATDTYHSTWTEPGINCETCHGPGAEHVRVCLQAVGGEAPKDLHIISTRVFDAAQTNAMCAPCHAKMVPITASFRPGEKFFDHYDLVTLEDIDFYPDGRDLGENYTMTTWRMSPCAKSGELDCMHCHTSSGRFRFADDPNAACLPCHQTRVENATVHTHHKPDSDGNHCISCHMPTTRFANMMRSDHSMLPPTPAATLAYESPNACNLCHTDQDAAWADRLVREWHDDDGYQQPVLYRAGLVDAARKGDWSRLPDILAYLTEPDRDEVTATGLIRLLANCSDESKWPVLARVLSDKSPLVRAAAAQQLGGHLTPETLPALLEATADDVRLVRIRSAAALAPVDPVRLPDSQRTSLERATEEFIAAMHARPDDHASYHSLGLYYSQRHKFHEALAAYQTASRLEPRAIQPLVNASLVYNLLGRNDEAEKCLRKALETDPTSLAANLNLGMLLGEMGRRGEAEAAFRAALKADPESAQAAYNLAVLVADRDVAETIELCRKASRLRPDMPKYAFGLAFYLHQSGDTAAAIDELQGALAKNPDFVDGYALLGSLFIHQGRTAEAKEVFEQAASNESLPPAVRSQFAARARALAPQ